MGLAARDQREVGHPGQSGGRRERHSGIPATGLHARKTVAGAARRAQRVTAAPATARGLRKNRKDYVDGQSVAERAGGRYCAGDHAEVAAIELGSWGGQRRFLRLPTIHQRGHILKGGYAEPGIGRAFARWLCPPFDQELLALVDLDVIAARRAGIELARAADLL